MRQSCLLDCLATVALSHAPSALDRGRALVWFNMTSDLFGDWGPDAAEEAEDQAAQAGKRGGGPGEEKAETAGEAAASDDNSDDDSDDDESPSNDQVSTLALR